MKRIILIALAFLMCISAVACGNDTPSDSKPNTTTSNSTDIKTNNTNSNDTTISESGIDVSNESNTTESNTVSNNASNETSNDVSNDTSNGTGSGLSGNGTSEGTPSKGGNGNSSTENTTSSETSRDESSDTSSNSGGELDSDYPELDPEYVKLFLRREGTVYAFVEYESEPFDTVKSADGYWNIYYYKIIGAETEEEIRENLKQYYTQNYLANIKLVDIQVHNGVLSYVFSAEPSGRYSYEFVKMKKKDNGTYYVYVRDSFYDETNETWIFVYENGNYKYDSKTIGHIE